MIGLAPVESSGRQGVCLQGVSKPPHLLEASGSREGVCSHLAHSFGDAPCVQWKVWKRPGVARSWLSCLRFPKIPDSHLQTFVREHLCVFPSLPLVVNLAHSSHPGGAASEPVSSLIVDELWVGTLQGSNRLTQPRSTVCYVLSRVSCYFG